MGDVTRGDSGRPGSSSRRVAMLCRAIMALLVVLTAASWVTVVWLMRLPSADDSGGMVLYYYWQHTSGWWSSVVLLAAAVLSPILAAGLLFQVVRRVHGRWWRVMTMAVGGGAWLCGAAYLAVIAFFALLLVGVEGTQTIARAPDGTTLMITQDGFDGDNVDVWRPKTSVNFLREPGFATVDPRSGPCRLDRETESQVKLTCGSTSQLISAGTQSQ